MSCQRGRTPGRKESWRDWGGQLGKNTRDGQGERWRDGLREEEVNVEEEDVKEVRASLVG